MFLPRDAQRLSHLAALLQRLKLGGKFLHVKERLSPPAPRSEDRLGNRLLIGALVGVLHRDAELHRIVKQPLFQSGNLTLMRGQWRAVHLLVLFELFVQLRALVGNLSSQTIHCCKLADVPLGHGKGLRLLRSLPFKTSRLS